MGVRPPQKPTPPPPNPRPTPQFILSLSKDELAPNPKIPHPNPLTTIKLMFYNNPNAKTSSPKQR